MSLWFFVTDLHGSLSRYQKLFQLILAERPEVVLLGGDILPSGVEYRQDTPEKSFIHSVLQGGFESVKENLSFAYPKILLILGN
ncbi:MAG TPA: metallophosphoesterase, partial [Anaerolineales bacterium]|nr:metallophosphoesterase [Anaerolineales bacterium]